MDFEMESIALPVPPSSISFTSSSHTSSGSIDYSIEYCYSGSDVGSTVAINTLSRPSNTLEQLYSDASSKFSDAEIVVDGIVVGVQLCKLAVRSKFFQELFVKEKGNSPIEGKPRYCLVDMLPYGKVGYEAFLTFLSYLKCGKLKPFPPEVSICVDAVCAHDSCRPAISFAVELMYASSVFQVSELASLIQRRLLIFVEKGLVEDVIPILMVAFHCQSSQLLTCCVDRIARSDFESICIEKEAPYEIAESIKRQRQNFGENENEMNPLHEKGRKKICMALDSGDIELVKLLLDETAVTFDDVYALHYAVAYCDSKVVFKALDLGWGNVNLRNSRGYTLLHVAAMRNELSVIVSLLTKGANASALTLDGRTAAGICRRLTRPKDYHVKQEIGQETKEDQKCIDVLEREMHRNPMAAEEALLPYMRLPFHLHVQWLWLENRVALARILFPQEAKIAMQISNAETTSELACPPSLDLNESPVVHNQRIIPRIKALSKTVELGKHFFPGCSQVLDKFLEDDSFDSESGTPDEERHLKRSRYNELKDLVQRAFDSDSSLAWLHLSTPS